MYKRKKQKQKIICITLLILFFIIGIIVNVLIKDRNLLVFEKGIKDSILMIENFLTSPIDAINNKEEIIENKYKIENEELKKEINDLKKSLNISNTLSEYDIVNANVVTRDLNSWQDLITINKGENDGITKNMAVVVENNLIGKVINTSFNTSTIRLITANDIIEKISVKIKNNDKYVYGILNKYNNKQLVEGISYDIKINNGSIVTTTGMGNIYPSGIIIGQVVGSETDNFDLSKVLEVKSFIDFNDIKYVNVLKRKI